jgi:hypothetical protein
VVTEYLDVDFSIIRSFTISACSWGKLRTSKNGTTSNEEIPIAQYSNVTIHKRVSLISGFIYALKYDFHCGI